MKTRRTLHQRLLTLASVTALGLGTITLVGCGDDEEEMPAQGEQSAVEETTQDNAAMQEDPVIQEGATSEEGAPIDGEQNQTSQSANMSGEATNDSSDIQQNEMSAQTQETAQAESSPSDEEEQENEQNTQ